MKDYSESHHVWNSLAALYEQRFMTLPHYNESYRSFCEWVKTLNAEVLELGCGPGNVTKHLQQLRPDFQILATDVAPAMLEHTIKNVPGVQTQLLDCRAIADLNRSFHGIVAAFCIPYIDASEAKTFIAEVYASLHKDGVFYLSYVPGSTSLSGYKTNSRGDRMYFHYHESAAIQSQLKHCGFSICAHFAIDYPLGNDDTEVHEVLICIK